MELARKSMERLETEDKVKVCTDCGSKEIDFDKGETYCKKCGLVFD